MKLFNSNKGQFFYFVVACLLFSWASIEAAKHPAYVSEDVWALLEPYLMPESHPLKPKLDRMFSKRRVIRSLDSLRDAGFKKAKPQPHTKIVVTTHKKMKGYIFKIYTDDRLENYRGHPEYVSYMLRARGAKLVRDFITEKNWGAYFKAPRKWIYALPESPKASKRHVQRNFILVEDEMDILPDKEMRKRWNDGTITTTHLDMLFELVTTLGLRGGCKYDNIPICKDGRIAFIDTENNLRWPLPYERLFQILEGALKDHWQRLINQAANRN